MIDDNSIDHVVNNMAIALALCRDYTVQINENGWQVLDDDHNEVDKEPFLQQARETFAMVRAIPGVLDF